MEAILTAGHIPAGMELFTAGDQSQMNVIKRWIDESDIYLLILGGRYGSIESVSQKSYIHLEYDYAVEKNKPLFTCVIDEEYLEAKVKQFGSKIIEKDNPKQLHDFRQYVLTKMVKFWSDPRDIKLAILETLSEFSRREDLVGWISGNEAVNGGALAEELARLTKENAELRQQIAQFSSGSSKYHGLTYEEFYNLLSKTDIDENLISPEHEEVLRRIAQVFGQQTPKALHLLWLLSSALRHPHAIQSDHRLGVIKVLEKIGVVELKKTDAGGTKYFGLTQPAKEFLLRLRLEHDLHEIERYAVQRY